MLLSLSLSFSFTVRCNEHEEEKFLQVEDIESPKMISAATLDWHVTAYIRFSLSEVTVNASLRRLGIVEATFFRQIVFALRLSGNDATSVVWQAREN